jgi:ribosomal protein S18
MEFQKIDTLSDFFGDLGRLRPSTLTSTWWWRPNEGLHSCA